MLSRLRAIVSACRALILLQIRIARGVLAVALPVMLVAGVLFVRGGGVDPRPVVDHRPALTVGAAPGALSTLKAAAADQVAAALAKGGSGISFEIVQRSTIKARPGGPGIPVPDSVDPQKTLGLADEYFLNAIIERGFATPGGFYSEMLAGPAPGSEPDWNGVVRLQALERDGKVYRNDGDGWYVTTTPPGIGLDPVTARLLPALVRNATAPADAGVDAKDASLRNVTATGKVADIPGVVAADGATFTELTEPVTFKLDPDGRLASLHLVALNTNMETFDLVVETDITLRYAVDGPLPDASPVLSATKAAVQP